MLIIALLYVGIGAGLAVVTLGARGFRQRIDHIARQTGISAGYGRTVWLGGTVVLWPIGLYTLMTGRLVMADDPLCKRNVGTIITVQRTITREIPRPCDTDAHRRSPSGDLFSDRLRMRFRRSPPPRIGCSPK